MSFIIIQLSLTYYSFGVAILCKFWFEKKHFDFRLDTARLDKTEYTEEMKVDDEGKKFLSI